VLDYAEMVCTFFVNSQHDHSQKPYARCKTLYFYGTTTLWCPSMNPIVERYGTQLWIQRRYDTLTQIQFIAGTQNVPWLGLGYHNITVGTTTILKCYCVMWYKSYFDTSNRLGVAH